VSFAGGTSATSANPQLAFANTGTYSVTLTASNSAGSDTVISATCITVVSGGSPGQCDTLMNISNDDTLAVYSTQGNQYVTGMNEYNDEVKAEKFLSSSYTFGNSLMGAYIYFYKYSYASAASNVNVKVWDASGAGGSPGASALATKNVLLNTIPNSGQNAGFAYVPFSSAVPVTGDFFVGVEFTNPYVVGDTVAIISNRNGNTPSPGTAWEKYSGVWGDMHTDWGLNLSLYIAPVLCPITTTVKRPAGDVDDISIYPNPSNALISVMVGLNKTSEVKIEIYNSIGQLINSAKMETGNGGKVDFDLSGNNNGVYFVKVQTGSSVSTKRVILRK
jgi:PKD repeat protein